MLYLVILSLVTLVACLLSNWYAAQRAKHASWPKIVDSVHDHIPPIPKWIPELLMILPVVYLVLSCQWTWLSRGAEIYLWMLLFKCVFVHATVLPSIDRNCDRPFFTLGNCNDYMFSGHTVLVTVAALAAMSAGLWSPAMAGLYVMVTMIAITAARNHYFVDTLVAALFTVAVWKSTCPH